MFNQKCFVKKEKRQEKRKKEKRQEKKREEKKKKREKKREKKETNDGEEKNEKKEKSEKKASFGRSPIDKIQPHNERQGRGEKWRPPLLAPLAGPPSSLFLPRLYI